MKWPPNADGRAKPAEREPHKSTAPNLSARQKSVNAKARRELSFRQICEIMGRNLRVIIPNGRQLELFEDWKK
jgi:hypothetical protein